jgi:hypothetical protein
LAGDDGSGTNVKMHGDQQVAQNNGFAIWAQNHNASLGNDYNSMPPNNVQLRVKSQPTTTQNAPDYQSSEVIIDGRIDDDPRSYLRLQNATNIPYNFIPLISGYHFGLVLSAKVPTNSDLTTSAAMMEFDVRTGDSTLVSSVSNRNLFRWCNYDTVPMLMNANGQLGIKPNNSSALSTRVEIEAGNGDFGYTINAGSPGAIGASGLRFTRLKSQSATVTNPGLGVLSVNQTGDVIYVPSPISTCTWDLLGANDLYTGVTPACRTGNVAIGTALPLAKLHVANTNTSSASVVSARVDANGGSGSTTAISSYAAGNSTSYIIGVKGIATGSVNKNVGGQFSVNYTTAMLEGIGCLGQSNSNLGIGVHTGVKGEATGGKYNLALFGGAHGNNGAINNIGVFGEATGTGNNWAVYANGAAGTVGGYFVVSDLVLKHNPTDISNSETIINSLRPKTYSFKTGEYPNLNMPAGVHYGLISANVATVLPHSVKRGHIQQMKDTLGNVIADSLSFDMVNYTELIPILIDYVQHQQVRIDSLENQMNICCGNKKTAISNDPNTTHIAVSLENKLDCVLFQNQPNPFEEKTQIKVLLSDLNLKAELVITSLSGIVLYSSVLGNTAENIIDIDTSNLPSGTYLYSLYLNGNLRDTKKMIKE